MADQATHRALTIWLVDDEQQIYAALLRGLQGNKRVESLRWFSSCTMALDAVPHELAPDIVLLDINMPGMSGVDAIPLFQRAVPSAKIIMLTVERGMQNILRATTFGVSGYLLKPFRCDEVLIACERALGGGMPFDPDIMPSLIKKLSRQRRSLAEFGLTDVQQLIAQQIGRGLNNDDIAAALQISSNTVKRHVTHILSKMGSRTRSQLIAKLHNEQLV